MPAHKFMGSSNIDSIEHDEAGKLIVRFHNGTAYEYPNVSTDLVNRWKSAPSAGKFFHANIRSLSGKKHGA